MSREKLAVRSEIIMDNNVLIEPIEGHDSSTLIKKPPLSSFDKAESHLQNLLRIMNISEGWTVLEPGCGPGKLSPRLAEEVGPEGRILSFDTSMQMIRRLRNRELPRNVLSFVSSIRAFPLKDGFCDCIVYVNGFQPIADKARCLKEFSRVLKPKGHLWITGFETKGSLSTLADSVSAGLPTRPVMMDFLQHVGLQLLMFKADAKEYVIRAVKRT